MWVAEDVEPVAAGATVPDAAVDPLDGREDADGDAEDDIEG